jgi:hypothetical protein
MAHALDATRTSSAEQLIASLDMFFGILVNWDQYLAPAFAQLSPIGVSGLPVSPPEAVRPGSFPSRSCPYPSTFGTACETDKRRVR